MAAVAAMGGDALGETAALEARLATLKTARASVQRELKISGQKRRRLAEKLRGWEDADVLAVLGMRQVARAKAAAKAVAKAAAKAAAKAVAKAKAAP